MGILELQSPLMKNGLGIARGLDCSLEHQIARGMECLAIEAGSHRPVERIAGVLSVYDCGHALHHIHDLLLGHHAVAQPVGNVLRRDPAGCAIFHEADVMNVWHLGAADPLIDPAYDIAEDALSVVLEFGPDVVGAPVGVTG